MKNVSRLAYIAKPPPGQKPTARARATAAWFGGTPVVLFGMLLQRYPRYPLVEGGRHG
jgi:hypothetical protein